MSDLKQVTPAQVVQQLYVLVNKYGKKETYDRSTFSGEGSDRTSRSDVGEIHTFKRGILEIKATRGNSSSSYGTYSVGGSSHSYAYLSVTRKRTTLMHGSEHSNRESSTPFSESVKSANEGWDVSTVHKSIAKILPEFLEDIVKKVTKRRAVSTNR